MPYSDLKRWTRSNPSTKPGLINSKRYNRVMKTTVTMGKKFRTRAGRYGCYVYINGRRSHFEPAKGSEVDMKMYYKNKRK